MDVERRELEESAQSSSTPNAFVSALILECPSLRVVTVLMSSTRRGSQGEDDD